jgi:hypothetical protein
MTKRWRLKLTNGWVGVAGVLGVGLVPCPDCGLPLAVHIWPVAGVIWLYRYVRRRQLHTLDLLLDSGLVERAHPAPEPTESPNEMVAGG